jgi:two-component system, NarL family, response regulator NreC
MAPIAATERRQTPSCLTCPIAFFSSYPIRLGWVLLRNAATYARALSPTVVLLDCTLPDRNGLVVAAQIANSFAQTGVLVCSMHSEESWVRRAKEAGARGYVFKSATDLDLPSAIKRVAAGELVFGEYTFEKLPPKAATTSGLSAREREALQLIVNGRSNRQIADQLRLSAHTVGVHRANIMKALRIHKTAELATYAIRKGLATIP